MTSSEPRAKSIGLGCDHLGLELKNALKAHLETKGLTVTDIGVNDETPVDYPDIGAELARRLAYV